MRRLNEIRDAFARSSYFQRAEAFLIKNIKIILLLTIASAYAFLLLPLYAAIWKLNKTSIQLLIPIGVIFGIWWIKNTKDRTIILAASSITLAILLFFFQATYNAINIINSIQATNVVNCDTAKIITKTFEEGKNLSTSNIVVQFRTEPYLNTSSILQYYGLDAAKKALEVSSKMEAANNLIERVESLILVEQTTTDLDAFTRAVLAKSEYNARVRDLSRGIEALTCEEFMYKESEFSMKYHAVERWLRDRITRVPQK